jgi:ABC-type multidrug transport system fused ATPase/permease subunit
MVFYTGVQSGTSGCHSIHRIFASAPILIYNQSEKVAMSMHRSRPNFRLRDLAGLIAVLLLAAALVAAAFLTHAGPFILIGLLIVLIFFLLRRFRERGREAEAKEVVQALRTRLHKGEELQAYTIGDRRRFKPLTALSDFALAMFSQGLAADGAAAIAADDTLIGLTDRRLIAIERQKRPPGQKTDWRDRLKLRRVNRSKGKHAIIFEAPRAGLDLSVRLAVFYLARLTIQGEADREFSIGLNSRYWAERAVALEQVLTGSTGPPS